MLSRAAKAAFSAKNATSAFKKCGLLPLNPIKVLKDLKIAADVIQKALELRKAQVPVAASGAGASKLSNSSFVALVCIMMGLEKPPPPCTCGAQ